MKIRLVLLTSMLLVVSACTCEARGRQSNADRAMVDRNAPIESSDFSTLPDLIVVSVGSDNLDNGEVKVKIKNQGLRRAVRSDVVLTITWGPKTVSFTHSSIPLNPGQTDTVIIEVKISLVQAKSCATVDGTNKVTESNENNNKRCGQFGGKL